MQRWAVAEPTGKRVEDAEAPCRKVDAPQGTRNLSGVDNKPHEETAAWSNKLTRTSFSVRAVDSSSSLRPDVPEHQDKGGKVDENTDKSDDSLSRQGHYPITDSELVLIVLENPPA
jgi:hypothetical protein